jgi:hypothetical protein
MLGWQESLALPDSLEDFVESWRTWQESQGTLGNKLRDPQQSVRNPQTTNCVNPKIRKKLRDPARISELGNLAGTWLKCWRDPARSANLCI